MFYLIRIVVYRLDPDAYCWVNIKYSKKKVTGRTVFDIIGAVALLLLVLIHLFERRRILILLKVIKQVPSVPKCLFQIAQKQAAVRQIA